MDDAGHPAPPAPPSDERRGALVARRRANSTRLAPRVLLGGLAAATLAAAASGAAMAASPRRSDAAGPIRAPVALSAAAAPTTTGTPLEPAAALVHLFTRTSAGGVTIRVYREAPATAGTTTTTAPGAPVPPPLPCACPAKALGPCPCVVPGCASAPSPTPEAQGTVASTVIANCPVVTPATGCGAPSLTASPGATGTVEGPIVCAPGVVSPPSAPSTSWSTTATTTTTPRTATTAPNATTTTAPRTATTAPDATTTTTQATTGPGCTIGTDTLELSTDAAVSSTMVPVPTTPAVLALDATGTFGTAEGSPAGWVAVSVGATVAEVRLVAPPSSGAPGDTMAPLDGLGVLASSAPVSGWSLQALGSSGQVLATLTVPTTPVAEPLVGCAAPSPGTTGAVRGDRVLAPSS